jgi:hypothetical protein
MAGVGAPIGNTYAAKGRRWSDAINNALGKRSRAAGIQALDELAEKLLTLCDEGDISALRELGDRLEGKPAQAITGADGGPIVIIQAATLDESL